MIDYLVVLGIAIPPISSIFVVDALIFRTNFSDEAHGRRPRIVVGSFIAWILAIFVAFLALKNVWSITGMAALDSIVVAMLVSLTLRLAANRLAKSRSVGEAREVPDYDL